MQLPKLIPDYEEDLVSKYKRLATFRASSSLKPLKQSASFNKIQSIKVNSEEHSRKKQHNFTKGCINLIHISL